jgi:hypothetical protein
MQAFGRTGTRIQSDNHACREVTAEIAECAERSPNKCFSAITAVTYIGSKKFCPFRRQVTKGNDGLGATAGLSSSGTHK